MKKRTKRRWSKKEVTDLAQYYLMGDTCKTIAQKLNRTEKAVTVRLYKERKKDGWLAELKPAAKILKQSEEKFDILALIYGALTGVAVSYLVWGL